MYQLSEFEIGLLLFAWGVLCAAAGAWQAGDYWRKVVARKELEYENGYLPLTRYAVWMDAGRVCREAAQQCWGRDVPKAVGNILQETALHMEQRAWIAKAETTFGLLGRSPSYRGGPPAV